MLSLTTPKLQLADPWTIESPGPGLESARADPREGIALRVGDRPFARSIARLYELRGEKMPPDLAALPGDTYLITHAVGLVAETGANRIDRIGYTATFQDAGSTIELFPNTRFKEYFSANVGFEAGVGADGYAKMPTLVGTLGSGMVELGAGAELKLSTKAGMLGKLSLSIKSPKIQAVGIASSSVSWQIDKDNDPLVGDQVLVQTLLVPTGTKKITFRVQAYAMVDPGLFARAVRLQTEPLDVGATLDT